MSPNPFHVTVETLVQENEALQRIRHAMKAIREQEALIGIPQEANAQHEGGITNADLLYIHTYGSPVNGIPPRDVLDSSLKHAKQQIVDLLGEALAKACEGNQEAAEAALKRAGIFAEGRAKDWFTNSANGWDENADSTVQRKGSDMPLIDSGELRKSITSVVRKKGERRH